MGTKKKVEAKEKPAKTSGEVELRMNLWAHCLANGWGYPPQPAGSNILEKAGASPRVRLIFGSSELTLETKRLLTKEELEAHPSCVKTVWDVTEKASYDKVKMTQDGVIFDK
jgi:hypothetical protein